MKELSISEMKGVNGGASFAYRVGQGIRWLILSQSMEGRLLLHMEGSL